MKVLVTGFDPFGGEKINPSIEAVKRLPEELCGAKLIREEIPTCRVRGMEKMKELKQRTLNDKDRLTNVNNDILESLLMIERKLTRKSTRSTRKKQYRMADKKHPPSSGKMGNRFNILYAKLNMKNSKKPNQ